MLKKLAAVLICLLCLFTAGASVFAADSSEISEAKKQLETIQNDLENMDQTIQDTQSQITAIDNEIEALNTQIADLESQMSSTKQKISELQAQRDSQEELFGSRSRVMYMYGTDGYLEVLFSSSSFMEMLSRLGEIQTIVAADRATVDNLDNTVNQLNSSIQDLEDEQNLANQAKSVQEQAKETQSTKLAQLQEAYNSEVEAGKALALQFGLNNYFFSDYMWPIDLNNANALTITSGFGTRTSPGGIGSPNHQGVDIGVSEGTPVLAMADGTVTSAGNVKGYGNYIALDHGKDSSGQTIGSGYGHLSSIQVSKGQTVTKGQVIGLSGNTGTSTGPHLHFNFYVNSTPVNALDYFPSLNFNVSE